MDAYGASIAKGNGPGRGAEQLRVRNTVEDVEAAEKRLIDRLERLGYDESSRFAIRLAFQEAMSNARIHGNAQNPAKSIAVRFDLDEKRAAIDIQDEGTGFDPSTVPDPRRDENLQIPAGRGLTLIRAFMTEVEILPPGNRIRMSYARA